MKTSCMRALPRHYCHDEKSSYTPVTICILSHMLKTKALNWEARLHSIFTEIYLLDNEYQRDPTRENAQRLKKLKRSYRDSMAAYNHFMRTTDFYGLPRCSSALIDSLPEILKKKAKQKVKKRYVNDLKKEKKRGRNAQLIERDFFLEYSKESI